MDIASQYSKNGYFLLENAYSDDEVDKIKSLVSRLNIEEFEHSKDATGYPFRITNILPKNQELKKLIEKPKIISTLKQCIGDDVIFLVIRDYTNSKSSGFNC